MKSLPACLPHWMDFQEVMLYSGFIPHKMTDTQRALRERISLLL